MIVLLQRQSGTFRRIGVSVLTSTFVLSAFGSLEAQMVYDLSNMDANNRVTLVYDADDPDIVSGVFRNSAPENKVRISARGWVGPVGAGIFHASEEHPLSRIRCRFVVRDGSGVSRLLDLEGYGTGLWHESQVIANKVLLRSDGSQSEFTLASPIDGTLTSVVYEPEPASRRVIETTSEGVLLDGRVAFAEIGTVEILFRANLNSPTCYLFLSKTQEELLGSG